MLSLHLILSSAAIFHLAGPKLLHTAADDCEPDMIESHTTDAVQGLQRFKRKRFHFGPGQVHVCLLKKDVNRTELLTEVVCMWVVTCTGKLLETMDRWLTSRVEMLVAGSASRGSLSKLRRTSWDGDAQIYFLPRF